MVFVTHYPLQAFVFSLFVNFSRFVKFFDQNLTRSTEHWGARKCPTEITWSLGKFPILLERLINFTLRSMHGTQVWIVSLETVQHVCCLLEVINVLKGAEYEDYTVLNLLSFHKNRGMSYFKLSNRSNSNSKVSEFWLPVTYKFEFELSK